MKVFAIALNTFREAIRNKILYSILLFALVVVGIAAIFGSASIGDQMKFVKDFSLMSISLFGVVIAVVLGVSLLSKELGKRTILNILSKPVARWEFVVGKFFGLLATMALIVAMMSAGLIAFLAAFERRLDWGLVLASGTSLLEVMVIIAIALFFSSVVVTPTLAGLFTAAAFVAGRSASYLAYFTSGEFSPSTQMLARTLYWILPHLQQFNIGEFVVYGDSVAPSFLLALLAYAAAYSAVMLMLSVAVFSRREFT